MSEVIEYETSDGIATIRLDRPAVRNALNEQLLTDLVAALERVDAEDDIAAIIVTGNGSAFSAGGDFDEVNQWLSVDHETFETELSRFQAVIEQLRSMPTPSVAAVNGPAVGAGCDIALACDLRVVEPEATFSEGFVNIGMISGDGGAWLLPRLIGESKAKQYLLTGKTMDASEAVDVGLAIAATDNAEIRARELAAHLRELPSAAVRRTKTMATMTPETLVDHFADAIKAQWACLQSPETVEILTNRLGEPEADESA